MARMLRQIILDTETTGLLTQEGHRLIEVGCLEMINRRLTGRNLHYYINPERPVDKGAFEVHGLSDQFLQDKPVFKTIAQELFHFISGAELVIHNASFDIGFLDYEFKLLNENYQPIAQYCQILDTLSLARKKHPGQSNSLDALCRRYKVDNSVRDLHGALLDARLLAQVYLSMTGGQEQLFMDHTTPVVENQEISAFSQEKTRVILPVISPNAQEKAAHAEFLALLQKNGKCLWQEADE